MFDRCDHNTEAYFVHHHTGKVDNGHAVRAEGVRYDGVCTVLEQRSPDKENGNQQCLNKDSRLKEETTENRICQRENISKISVIIDEELTVKAVKKLHNIFNLD